MNKLNKKKRFKIIANRNLFVKKEKTFKCKTRYSVGNCLNLLILPGRNKLGRRGLMMLMLPSSALRG
jgi:hypothetical protein